jgi:hypothetical protein
MVKVMQDIQNFHDHLDRCEQCRNHPFALCAKGYKLLVIAASGDESKNYPEKKYAQNNHTDR